jgi:hypothetical protein
MGPKVGLVDMEKERSYPCHLLWVKEPPGTHWIGGWMGLKADMTDMEKRKIFVKI